MSWRALRAWVGQAPWAWDWLAAGGCATALVFSRAFERYSRDLFHVDLERHLWHLYVLPVAAGLTLVGLRRWPRATWLVALLIAVVDFAVDPATGIIALPALIAACWLAQVEARRPGLLIAVATAVALMLASGALQRHGWSDARTAIDPAAAMAGLFLGWAITGQRAYMSEIRARASEAERTREEEGRRRVDAERVRIAREVHDVIAHSISMISLHAGVATHLSRERPEQAQQSLRIIKATSQETLSELRSILGLLRGSDAPELDEPAPGMQQLDALVAATIRAGVPTQMSVSGARRRPPPTVDLAAYRIVQESLTNVLRHAPGAAAKVTIAFSSSAIDIDVQDDGPGPAARSVGDGAGRGIAGMRERALALGGHLRAGPAGDGGFHVSARLPAPV